MTLVVHTARISSRDPARLDITHKSATGDARAFAPSEAILWPALALLKTAKALDKAARASGDVAAVETGATLSREIDRAAWALYSEAYRMLMRERYRTHRAAWDALLTRERVVLVCYCADPLRCHRRLLAAMLASLGATDAGEL